MRQYEYRAVSANGQEIRGSVSAENANAARQMVASCNLRVIDIVPSLPVEAAEDLGEVDVDALVQAVGGAAASRIPLEVSLAALAEEKSDPRLAAMAERLSSRLQQGATIDETINELDGKLPMEIAGLLRAGFESGDLAGTFERFGQQRLAAARFSRRIRATLAYPALIVAILVPLLLFLSMYVVPMFADLYREFALTLPTVTEVILQTARQLPALIGGIALFVIGFPLALRVFGGRWLLHRVRATLPFLGRLWMWAGQREFAAQLASFLSLGLPMPSAVAYTAQVISDRNVGRACQRVGKRVEDGQTLSSSLSESIHFDRSLVALVNWGETHGALPDALAVATNMFDDYVEQQASLVRRLLPPITLVSVATLVGFVLLGLMIPMVKLIEGLSH